jgi:hypothetical protein
VSLPWNHGVSSFRPRHGQWAFWPSDHSTARHDGADCASRTIEVTDPLEAELLTTAFHRFVELHGRVACDPQSRCALHGARGAPDRAQTMVVALWSPRAATEFDRFWESYRCVYGPGRAWDLEVAGVA